MLDKLEPDSSWKCFHSKSSGEIVISQYCPERAYVELQVPLATRAVRRIVFTTISHDQGFSGEDQQHHGTYNHSYTWFQVAIITPSGRNRVAPQQMQINVHGSFEYRTHVNTWDYRDGDPFVSGFLKEIQAGDVIQIIPKALYIAWQNHVKEAEIELFIEEMEATCIPEFATESTMEKTPIYYPLSKAKEIRLIKLQPGLYEDELSCSIEYTSLGEEISTPYEALSYCWGKTENGATLKITPTSESKYTENAYGLMTITSNLRDALKNLRYNDSRYRMLWIDAICINQTDLEERVQQIQIMTDIYSHALQTIVWLGDSNLTVKKDIKDAQMILERYKEALAGQRPMPNFHSPPYQGDTYQIHCSLFSYHYFSRVWVLQEAYNAKKISVYCGQDIISWSMVLRLNDCINRTMLRANPLRKSIMVPLFAGLFKLKMIQDASDILQYTTKKSRMGILEVLVRGLDLNATDPRDKIFALLGFGQETFDLSQLPSEIRPNYSKSIAQVFRDFTRWWILTNRSLRILSAIQLSVGRTWQKVSSTQFSITSESITNGGRSTWSFWHDGISLWAQSTLGLLPNSAYCASGITMPDTTLISEETNPCILPLRGIKIATIKVKSIYPFMPFKRLPDHESLHEAYEAIFDPIDTRGTWLSGILQDELSKIRGSGNPEEDRAKLLDHISIHRDFAHQTGGGFECHVQSFFQTLEGAIGLCPTPAREGDIVAILCGGLVPYILRPREGESNSSTPAVLYELVGECYLEGFMHGEAMQQANHEPVALEVFEMV